jgi:excinuclease ABC subunit B
MTWTSCASRDQQPAEPARHVGGRERVVHLRAGLAQRVLGQGADDHPGSPIERRDFFLALNAMQYQRSDIEFKRGQYRARGDAIEVWPAYEKFAVRIELFGDEIERVDLVNPTSGELLAEEKQFFLFPAVHYVMPEDQLQAAVAGIRERAGRAGDGAAERGQAAGGAAAARADEVRPRDDRGGRVLQRDRELQPVYGRAGPGERPFTLMDYFDYAPAAGDGGSGAPRFGGADRGIGRDAEEDERRYGVTRENAGDWLLIIDESHVTLPQVRAMFNGDKARKTVLVEHGFRLPSALDNRPLTFEEFEAMVPAGGTSRRRPAVRAREVRGGHRRAGDPPHGAGRPGGRDPPGEGAGAGPAGALPGADRGGRARAGDGADQAAVRGPDEVPERPGLRVRYLHSEIETLERVEIITDLRAGEFDVLVGVNLLREGLDMPEVSWCACSTRTRRGSCGTRPA